MKGGFPKFAAARADLANGAVRAPSTLFDRPSSSTLPVIPDIRNNGETKPDNVRLATVRRINRYIMTFGLGLRPTVPAIDSQIPQLRHNWVVDDPIHSNCHVVLRVKPYIIRLAMPAMPRPARLWPRLRLGAWIFSVPRTQHHDYHC